MVSTDKLYELTVRTENGKPAPDFDTFIWGWGGDPYDPSFLLSLLTTGEIGGSSDSFYSNPEYDRLYREQTGIFDTEERKAVIQRDGRDHPARPALPGPDRGPEAAGLPDRPDRADVEPLCPEETGDLFCDQVSYEPRPRPRAGARGVGGGDGIGQRRARRPDRPRSSGSSAASSSPALAAPRRSEPLELEE